MSNTWADLQQRWQYSGPTWADIFRPLPAWLPVPSVTIADQDYTGRTVGYVTVRRGRDNVYASPEPGYATVELIDVQDGGLGFDVGAQLSVNVNNSIGQPVAVFTGFVSDWKSEVVARGGEPIVAYRVNAVGPLARLNRRRVMAGGQPQELDGARVLEAIEQSSLATWDEFVIESWDATPATVTWDTVDPGYDPALIDDGVFELAALDPEDSGYSALQVITAAGASAQGILFETGAGFIGYADADRRRSNARAGFLDIPFGVLAIGGFRLGSSLADVTNRVLVEFDGGVESQEDEFSIIRFGVQETVLSTQLANQANAEGRAIDFLFNHVDPRIELEQVTVNLRGSVLPLLRDTLLGAETNLAVRFPGMPVKTGVSGFRGFVEEVVFRLSEFEFEVGLFVSDEALSVGAVRWGQVDGTLEYGQVDPVLEYRDARSVEAV